MTQPLGVGFPDFARQASEAQVLEINDINVSGTLNVQYPIRYVGNAKALQLWANPTTDKIRIAVEFWGDAQGAVIMDSYVLHLQTNDVAKQAIPILGPYMSVLVNFQSVGVQSYTLQLWRTPVLGKFAGTEGDVAIISADGAAIGAGVSAIALDSQYVMEGPAVWSVGITGNSWDASINAVDLAGNLTELDHASNLSGFLTARPVYLPPWHIRINVVNRAAGAQTYSAFCTRRHNE